MRKIIVVHDPKQWTLGMDNIEVVSSRTYLTDASLNAAKGVRVFNLSRSYSYQSHGYYVSLLAEARGHKVIPSVGNILDMSALRMVKVLSKDLDGLIQASIGTKRSNEFILSIYFGRNVNKKYNKLSHELYKIFQAPLLRAKFTFGKKWDLRWIKPVPYEDVADEHQPYLKQFAAEYFAKKRYDKAREDKSQYDLAILVNDQDKNAPSNKRALVKFRQAGEALGFAVQVIGPNDIDKVSEFDALLIRENTHVDHHTYRFARKAQSEGIAVIDSPDAIMRCNNKVYLAELMTNLNIPTPKTMIVHSGNRNEVKEKLGLPCVLKLPDSTFSRGVVKAKTEEDLERELNEILKTSDLLIAQEFMPTDHDWRIGVLEGEAIYACKYFMAPDHWQIYNWESKTEEDITGNFATIPITEAPADVVDVAVRAVNAIGKGLFGVDVKELKGKPFLIEVNECPNIDHGIEDKVLGDELYRMIIGYLKKTIEQKIGIRP